MNAAVVIGLAAGALGLAPNSAQANHIWQRVTASSASNSNQSKSATATCPAGSRLFGAGAEIIGGANAVVIDDILPNAALSAVTVWAVEIPPGTPANWSVNAYAICVHSAGVQRVTASSVSNSASPKSATATCPAGTHLVGTGAEIVNGGGRVLIDEIVPNPALSAVTVLAYEIPPGTPANWSVRAHAICGNDPLGLQRVNVGSVGNSASPKSATATCPAGMRLVGTGAEIVGAGSNVLIDEIVPNPALSAVTVLAYEIPPGTPANWSVHAYAICMSLPVP